MLKTNQSVFVVITQYCVSFMEFGCDDWYFDSLCYIYSLLCPRCHRNRALSVSLVRLIVLPKSPFFFNFGLFQSNVWKLIHVAYYHNILIKLESRQCHFNRSRGMSLYNVLCKFWLLICVLWTHSPFILSKLEAM